MAFNSLEYLCFLPVALLLYYLVKQERRWIVLSVASFFFLGYISPVSLIVLLAATAVNYYLARAIASLKKNNVPYYAGIIINVLLIFICKFIDASGREIFLFFNQQTFDTGRIIATIGVSFYSLQSIAYLTEIRQGLSEFERNPGKFALYLSFFPKLVAGPIEQPGTFISQISSKKTTGADDIAYAFQRIVTGFFKKMVLADRLAVPVNTVFDTWDGSSGLTILVAVYLFTLQLYFDFSAYTDIAIGTARLFGYNLGENFRLPFNAASVTDFWRRWHISLIRWITQYLYYPVVYALRQRRTTAAVTGILVIFLISGCWHGLGITFLIWCLLHALFMIFEYLTKNGRDCLFKHLPKITVKITGIVLTFHFVVLANIFFRAGSVERAWHLIKGIFSFSSFVPGNYLADFVAPLGMGGDPDHIFNLYISFALALLFLVSDRFLHKMTEARKTSYILVFVMFILISVFGVFTDASKFIYTQF
ncbi:MAG: hypothetical protein KJ607_03270 [Bacteroidetes bacterium]|nr:hypothetical protein [Bacteroidota bacterium]